jgi:hypothetical protein
MSETIQLIRDVLDESLVDPHHNPMGRVDGLVLELSDAAPPRIVRIECGFPVLARRIHPRLGRWVRAFGQRFGVRRGRIYRIPFSRVSKIDIEITLELDADKSPALAWENWLRRHIIRHIPFST